MEAEQPQQQKQQPQLPPHDESDDSESDDDTFSVHSDHFGDQASRRQPQPVLSVDASAVFLIYIINFLDALGGSIVTPILPFYARELHADYTQIGWLFSVFAIAQMAAMPTLSWASDKFGRRSVLFWATFGSAVGGLLQANAANYTQLFVARIFSGACSGVASVCQVYLIDVVPPSLRAEYISYLNSSTQASVLFGPSIGAGLSVLGLNAPLCVQSGVSFLLCFVVYAHLPESPEWCRLNSPASPQSVGGTIRKRRTTTPGMGRRNMLTVIACYGSLSFCGMVAQMSILSMFAIYSQRAYDLDSVRVGFTMTLGAMSSVGTNIWISPRVLHKIGDYGASLIGFVLIFFGSCLIAMHPFQITCIGFVMAYQGLAINSSAVATGAANMTDASTRASIMTGTRMLKSLGAVVGPTLAGHLASQEIRGPFVAAACFGLLGVAVEVVSKPTIRRIKETLVKRRSVGKDSAFLEGQWIDEHGTPEEIWDLGVYVADLLTKRHYRWVTYNLPLKHFISDSFPELSKASEAAHRRAYDFRRRIVREQCKLDVQGASLSYQELLQAYQELQRSFAELEAELHRDIPRKMSKNEEQLVRLQEFNSAMSGFGGTY